ncbi:MAG: hypothetical protein J6S26_02355 [Solobacterium sp.]|nr:hypothetical protein [Solobacterium sp.]
MEWFGRFYLDKEKDMIVDLFRKDGTLFYTLRTPNHTTGNLIRNLAKLCDLELKKDENDLLYIEGQVPSYYDTYNRLVYIFRLGNTKVANIYQNGEIEMKAAIPSISKTLMSQTKHYSLDLAKTVVKTFIPTECKFHSDLHTHMNANLSPDVLIALGIFHAIPYPLYYIRKLNLRLSEQQMQYLVRERRRIAEQFKDSTLSGKYKNRKIDDNTFIRFDSLILDNPKDAEYNIAKIRASLAVMKDGQAVFSNLEKVYLYRYVFTKAQPSAETVDETKIGLIADPDIYYALKQMVKDRKHRVYQNNTLFQNKLLWIARGYAARGITYAEISDTTLVKREAAPHMLKEVHEVMPAVTKETGVTLRFLAGIRRIPLTIVKDSVTAADYLRENLRVLKAVAIDPYVAGSDIIGEEINDIRELRPFIHALCEIAAEIPSFVIRIHAGENDSLRDNVANAIECVKSGLRPGQPFPRLRIGHGLYTANLTSSKGKKLIREILETKTVLEFQITSNVRLNNLNTLKHHPLKQYLSSGIYCVQGTDGGALYGTDSVDEQLSLEKLLNLSEAELLQMRHAEDVLIADGLRSFQEKKKHLSAVMNHIDPEVFYENCIEAVSVDDRALLSAGSRHDSRDALAAQLKAMPENRYPIIIAGGSFNNDAHSTKMRPGFMEMIDRILEELDPDEVFFVIGDRLIGYEKYLAEHARGKFDVFAIVPTMVSAYERNRLLESGAGIVISIDPTGMGSYKSFAYEIFRRRESTLIAFDGNAAGANLIQEAKNGKHRAQIFVSRHSRALLAKAASLKGYVTVFGQEDDILPELEEKITQVRNIHSGSV